MNRGGFGARISFVMLAMVLMTASTSAASARTYRIGVVADGPWADHEDVRQLFQREILALVGDEFDVQFPDDKRIVADWTIAGVRAAIDQQYADRDVDILLTLGVLSSQVVGGRGPLPKPTIAPFVLDADIQSLPETRGGSGVKNLSYLAVPERVLRDLVAFRELFPYQHLTVVVNGVLRDLVPELSSAVEADLVAAAGEYAVVEEASTAQQVLDSLPADTDAVYLLPLLTLAPGESQKLFDGLIQRRLPSFSYFGERDVEDGVLAGLTPGNLFGRIARRVALHLQSILLGEAPSSLPVAFSDRERLTINIGTARKIGVWPPWSALTEAELIDDEVRELPRSVDLFGAAREAVEVNLDLLAEDYSVEAGAEEVRRAAAPLLPQADVSTSGVVIDQDRSNALFRQSERTWFVGGEVRQIIYAERAWAGYSIEKHFQRAREIDREALRLDVATAASSTFLDLLRARTFERIQKDNLELSRTNLELARVRVSIGDAGPEEVYRWETEIAGNRIEVIDAIAIRNQVELAVNRLLHRPIEESFTAQDVDPGDVGLMSADSRFSRYMRDPWSFRVFREIMVERGIAASVELATIDAGIEAQRRFLASAGRAFWAPDVGFQGEVSHAAGRGGSGSEEIPADAVPGLNIADDTDWSMAVSASLPLLTGGDRRAIQAQASADLDRLYVQRAATRERVEQRIRSALHAMGASFATIEQSRLAAAAAQRNLDLVTDSYSQGVVSIIELIDAQTAALNASQAAETAVYDFLIDLVEVERAVNRLDFFITAEARDAWFESVDAEFVARSAVR